MKNKTLLNFVFFFSFIVIAFSFVKSMPSNAADGEMPFTDVKKGRWFYDYIKYVYDKKIMTGLNETTFGPNDNVTRAMVVTVLWRLAGEPEPVNLGKVFPDVPTGKWYSKAVAWAKENKIVGGYQNGLFGTNDNIIRQDFVKILKGYTDYIGVEITADTIESYTIKNDAKNVSKYAIEFIQWAYQRSIIGQGSNLNPKGYLSRAENATMIMRFDKKVEEEKNKRPPVILYEGSYGDNITYKYDDKGTVTFSGTGELGSIDLDMIQRGGGFDDYILESAKEKYLNDYWNNYGYGSYPDFEDFIAPEIKTIVVEEGITSICEHAFFRTWASSVVLPDSVTYIGGNSFYEARNLTEIILPNHEITFDYLDDILYTIETPFKKTAYEKDTNNWDGDDLYIGNHFINSKNWEKLNDAYIKATDDMVFTFGKVAEKFGWTVVETTIIRKTEKQYGIYISVKKYDAEKGYDITFNGLLKTEVNDTYGYVYPDFCQLQAGSKYSYEDRLIYENYIARVGIQEAIEVMDIYLKDLLEKIHYNYL